MDPIAEAEDALRRGETARRDKRLADADDAFAHAVALLREADDPARLANALSRQAQVAMDLHDYRNARTSQDEAVALTRRAGGSSSLPHSIRHLADILRAGGEPAAAAPLYAEMMALYEGAPNTPPLEMANAVRSCACNAQALGDRVAALALWRDARARYEALDEVFRDIYGLKDNPGVAEADRRLAALVSPRRA
jgi:hypothetical protein